MFLLLAHPRGGGLRRARPTNI